MFSTTSNKDKDLLALLLIIGLCLLFLWIHPFWITKDAAGYVSSMEFLKSGIEGSDFSPFRIISNYAALNILIVGEKLFGDVYLAWELMNIFFSILASFIFYKIVHEIYGKRKLAFLTMLLFATNFAIAINGMAAALDLSGWTFYLAAVYFSLKYLKSGEQKYIYRSALMIGIGALFKEYALGGLPVLLGSIFYLNYGRSKDIFKLMALASFVSLFPVLVIHTFVYLKFGYTYLDWYKFVNARHGAGGTHAYKSRTLEFIKSFGAVYGFGWFLFCHSVYLLVKEKFKQFDKKILAYLALLFISALPVFFWPGIVPRTVFIMMFPVIIISGLTIKYFERYWYLFTPFFLVYASWGYFLDPYLFNLVNIDVVLKHILFWLY